MVASIHPINLSIHVKTAGIVNITPPKETMHTHTCMLAGVSIILKYPAGLNRVTDCIDKRPIVPFF